MSNAKNKMFEQQEREKIKWEAVAEHNGWVCDVCGCVLQREEVGCLWCSACQQLWRNFD